MTNKESKGGRDRTKIIVAAATPVIGVWLVATLSFILFFNE